MKENNDVYYEIEISDAGMAAIYEKIIAMQKDYEISKHFKTEKNDEDSGLFER